MSIDGDKLSILVLSVVVVFIVALIGIGEYFNSISATTEDPELKQFYYLVGHAFKDAAQTALLILILVFILIVVIYYIIKRNYEDGLGAVTY